MGFVPGEARVDVNDLVITSGFDDGIFPPGITIGNVSEVEGASSELEQDIKVEPAVDFNALEFVTILMESGPLLDDPKDKKPDKRDENGKSGPKSALKGSD
jgi:rod shape-determining protein MreC